MTTITVNEDNVRKLVADPDGEFDFQDCDGLATCVSTLLYAGCLNLPGDIEAVSYDLGGEDAGFIFAIRPYNSFDPYLNIATIFISMRDIEPRDDEGRLAWDGDWNMDPFEAVRQVAQHVAEELNPLVPTYEKVWG